MRGTGFEPVNPLRDGISHFLIELFQKVYLESRAFDHFATPAQANKAKKRNYFLNLFKKKEKRR